MEPKRLLITGAGGFLGSVLARDFSERGYVVTGLFHRSAPDSLPCDTEQMDLEDFAAIRQYLLWNRFDCVIHCAAVSTQKECEADRKRAFQVNVQATRTLAEASTLHRCRFVYISTDLVFDGSKGWYTEEDGVHPLSYYAETKCLAEQDVRLTHDNHLILRVALMYGMHGSRPGGFLGWTVDAMQNGTPLHLYLNQYRTILYARDAAEAIHRLFLSGARNETYHVAGPERLSRMEIGTRIAREFKLPEAEIRPARIARQILLGETDDIALRTDKIREATGMAFTPPAEGFAAIYRQWSAVRP